MPVWLPVNAVERPSTTRFARWRAAWDARTSSYRLLTSIPAFRQTRRVSSPIVYGKSHRFVRASTHSPRSWKLLPVGR